MPDFIQNGIETALIKKLYDPISVFFYFFDNGPQFSVPKGKNCAGFRLFSRFGQGFPLVIAQILEKEEFHMAAGAFFLTI